MHDAATAPIPRHRVMFNRVRWLLLVISAAAMAGLIACGSETVDTQPASSTGDGGPSPDELATVSTTL